MARHPRDKPDPRDPAEKAATQRLDKWLWHARFVKSRSFAIKLIEGGHIRVNRQKVTKASTCVKCGDILTATLSDRVRLIEVIAIAQRRGPASEAQQLYKERHLPGAPVHTPGGNP